jgi:hypothetical protein
MDKLNPVRTSDFLSRLSKVTMKAFHGFGAYILGTHRGNSTDRTGVLTRWRRRF